MFDVVCADWRQPEPPMRHMLVFVEVVWLKMFIVTEVIELGELVASNWKLTLLLRGVDASE